LSQMNGRWDRVCSLLEDWRGLLQDALLQCQVSRSPALGR
jgi:nesprin-1